MSDKTNRLACRLCVWHIMSVTLCQNDVQITTDEHNLLFGPYQAQPSAEYSRDLCALLTHMGAMHYKKCPDGVLIMLNVLLPRIGPHQDHINEL